MTKLSLEQTKALVESISKMIAPNKNKIWDLITTYLKQEEDVNAGQLDILKRAIQEYATQLNLDAKTAGLICSVYTQRLLQDFPELTGKLSADDSAKYLHASVLDLVLANEDDEDDDSFYFSDTEMIDGYLETALWAETDNSTEEGGYPLDKNYSFSDIDPESKAKAEKDCRAFSAKAGNLLKGLDASTVGHDFWLTRQGHGAGFWDGDYEESVGDALTELSKEFGEVYIYVGDDGKIYIDGGNDVQASVTSGKVTIYYTWTKDNKDDAWHKGGIFTSTSEEDLKKFKADVAEKAKRRKWADYIVLPEGQEPEGKIESSVIAAKGSKFVGQVGDFVYVMKVDGIDTDKLQGNMPEQLEELKKLKNFKSNAHRDYIRTKGKDAKKAVDAWVKEFGPSQYVVQWYKTDKDDSLEVYYAGKIESSLVDQILASEETEWSNMTDANLKDNLIAALKSAQETSSEEIKKLDLKQAGEIKKELKKRGINWLNVVKGKIPVKSSEGKVKSSVLKQVLADTKLEELEEARANNPYKDKKHLAVTFQTVTPESAEQGDFADHGYHDFLDCTSTEDETAVDQAIYEIKKAGASEPSSSQFHQGIYYTTPDSEKDYSTGEETTYSYHPHNFTPEEEKAIWDGLKAQKVISTVTAGLSSYDGMVVRPYKGNQYGIFDTKSKNWVTFGKKKDLENRLESMKVEDEAKKKKVKSSLLESILAEAGPIGPDGLTTASDDEPVEMKMVFKKFEDGDVIALFPDEIADYDGNIMSYQHVGQHGAASPALIQELEDASPEEYAPLKKELEGLGYIVKIVEASLTEYPTLAAVLASSEKKIGELKFKHGSWGIQTPNGQWYALKDQEGSTDTLKGKDLMFHVNENDEAVEITTASTQVRASSFNFFKDPKKDSQKEALVEFLTWMQEGRIENDANDSDYDPMLVGEEVEDQLTGVGGDVNGKKTQDIYKELTKGLTEEDIKECSTKAGIDYIDNGWAYYDGDKYKSAVEELKIKKTSESCTQVEALDLSSPEARHKELMNVVNDCIYKLAEQDGWTFVDALKEKREQYLKGYVGSSVTAAAKKKENKKDKVAKSAISDDHLANEMLYSAKAKAHEIKDLLDKEGTLLAKEIGVNPESEVRLDSEGVKQFPFAYSIMVSKALEASLTGGQYFDSVTQITASEDEFYTEEENEETQPDYNEDIFIEASGPLGSKTKVTQGGKLIGEFTEAEEVEKAIKAWIAKNNFSPNIWQVSDHGNIHPYTLE